VENQVGLVRDRFFTPRLRFKTYDDLDAWLMDRRIAWAKVHPHPENPEQTVWEVFGKSAFQISFQSGSCSPLLAGHSNKAW
jgi:hypothetical protein